MPVDPETYAKFLRAEQKAKDLGLSLMEVLDRAGLLLTPQRRRDIEVTAMLEIDRRLDKKSANELLSFYYDRPNGTAAEMLDCAQRFVETVVRNKINGTLEDT